MNAKIELPDKHQGIFRMVARAAAELGVEAYVVGGYVRDMLLGVPSKDIDIVVVGSGIQLAQEVGSRVGRTPAVYPNFGTAMLKVGDVELEFVGARKESYDRGSRKPIVEDGSLLDDLTRRDFTFNALAVALHDEAYGELVDMFSGIEHLHRRYLCTPTDPDVTLSDDPLRMFRAVRFAARFGATLDPSLVKSIQKNVDRISILSQERITDELNKILAGPSPVQGVELLNRFGLLERVLPELTALKGVDNVEGKGHKDNFAHTLVVLQHCADLTGDLMLRWAALLHDIGKAPTKRFEDGHGWTFHNHEEVGARMVAKIFTRLKHSLDDSHRVQHLVRLHGRPKSLAGNVTDSAVRRMMFEAGPAVDDLMVLVRSDFSTENPRKIDRHYAHCDLVEEKMRAVSAIDDMRAFRLAYAGDDLMADFNIKPGRIIGTVKQHLTDAVLDGKVLNEREALRQLAQEFMATQ